ncbi:LytR C-terminal domain-containing protein [Candidatus Microgenomates bacterium]|nr:LytR C-terminal domain-containing protein [Candidatus Microgenomates bacterium]
MEEETQSPVVNESPAPSRDFFGQPKTRKSGVAGPLVAVLVLLLLVGGVFFFMKSRGSSVESSPEPTIAEPIITEQTPSPNPAVNKADIKVKVLNGTGTSGEAGLLKDKLTAAGYTDVEAGNASRQDYTDAQVAFASDVPESVQDEIMSVLKSTYKGVKETSGVSSGFKVEIITGLRIGQTAKPSATATPTGIPKPSVSPSASPSANPQ